MQAFRCAAAALLLTQFLGCSDTATPTADVTSSTLWQTFEEPRGRYSIELPTSPPSPARANFAVQLSPRATFAVSVSEVSGLSDAMPAEWQAFVSNPADQGAAQQLLLEHIRQIVHRLKNPQNPNRPPENHTVVSSSLIEREGVLGADVVLQLDNGHTYTRRLFLTPEHVYEVLANIGAGEVDPAVSQRVIDSFYVKPVGTAVAAAPATGPVR